MSAKITIKINKNLTEDLLECGQLDVHHFVMFFNDELTPDEAAELVDHVVECSSCERMRDEVESTLKGQNPPTRVEALIFLKNLSTALWGMENELPQNFHRKHRRKLKSRLAKAEKRIKQLEQTLAQITSNITLVKEVSNYGNANQ